MIDPAALIERVQEGQLPALHLTVSQSAGDTFSKIGGLPQLPSDFQWPQWKNKPMTFLAQIDLAQIPAELRPEYYPSSGCLFFFYDQDQSTWGFDPADRGSWQVIYRESRPTAPLDPPQDLLENGIYPEKRIQFRQVSTFPSFERLGLENQQYSEIPDGTRKELMGLANEAFHGQPAHQMGGFPGAVQDDSMELECQLVTHGLFLGDASGFQSPRRAELAPGAQDWKLLLQLDTDEDVGMMWGDCGRLYFWIREEDLIARDFSNVWMILQCY